MYHSTAGSRTPPHSALDKTTVPSDERRAQELDRYFNPEQSPLKTDAVLPAYMQLITWRLGMQRALVTLVARDTQFNVAECTRTMDLLDASVYEHKNDAAWSGGVSNPKAGRLCAETLLAKAGTNGEPAYFEVCDLSSDQRFRNLEFVSGKPSFRYYCGVPICTKNNIVIGAVFALDHEVWSPMDTKLVKFLTVVASNVMAYFETRKETMDIKRVMKMNKPLAEFVGADFGENPSSDTRKQPIESRSDDSGLQNDPKDDHPEPQYPSKAQSTDDSPPPENSQQSTRKSSLSSAASTSDDEIPKADSTRDYSQIFDRAASLLQQSLDLELGGGVVFMDTASENAAVSSGARDCSEKIETKKDGQRLSVTCPSEHPLLRTPSDEGTNEDGGKMIAATFSQSMCPKSTAVDQNPEPKAKPPSRIPVKLLSRFIKRAPAGKIWYFPELRSGDVDQSMQSLNSQRRENKEENELAMLFSYLPEARQVLIIPFWNSHLSRWSVCLAYTNARKREFTPEIDYYYCRAFCGCVKAEIDRCTIILSDEQKGHFIGSISHELRSPLHSVLASCELLTETELTSFQSSLIDTTESCAHTLLDTINMVLDYSKINAFRRNHTPPGLNVKPQVVKGGVEPLLSIYSSVNIAAVTEEVIEGITTGHLARIDPSVQLDAEMIEGPAIPLDVKKPSVEIILEVSPPSDWYFVTQPGAFRRLIMNIFGNALKYTEGGFIKVLLGCEDIRDSDPSASTITLTVTDSGKSISRSYMQTKLFTAFAQENALAPGTGLGLSLVRSIVDMLNGQIDVQSKLNHGTTVIVRIPMKRTVSGSPAEESARKLSDGNVMAIRSMSPRPRLVVFHKESPNATLQQREARQMQTYALSQYTSGWYDLETLEDWESYSAPRPDVILVDDSNIPDISKYLQGFQSPGPALVVLCSNRSHTTAITKSIAYPRLHVMPKPFGPFKLAKVLRLAVEGSTPRHIPSVNTPGKSKSSIPDINREDTWKNKPSPTSRKAGATQGFPFPSMKLTQSSSLATLIPPPTPQLESAGTHHRRLKTLDVQLARQEPHERYDHLVRSHSDGQITREHKHRQPRVLLVDDNEVNLKLLQTFFVRRGYKDLALARDGSQAVSAYEEALEKAEPFHMIFMDISMPVMNGFEAASKIRHLESVLAAQRTELFTIPCQSLIIALTGNASAKDQASAFTHGIDMYMTKPVSLKEVGELMKIWEDNSKTHGAEKARAALLEINATTDE